MSAEEPLLKSNSNSSSSSVYQRPVVVNVTPDGKVREYVSPKYPAYKAPPPMVLVGLLFLLFLPFFLLIVLPFLLLFLSVFVCSGFGPLWQYFGEKAEKKKYFDKPLPRFFFFFLFPPPSSHFSKSTTKQIIKG